MRMTPVNKLPYGSPMTYKTSKLYNDLKKFLEMRVNHVEVTFDTDEYASMSSAVSSYATAAKRYNLPVIVSMREGKMYLSRKEPLDLPDVLDWEG